jgi:peptidoglycan/LPS O-acetylase OafA/YrhL
VLLENAAGLSALVIALRPVRQPLLVRLGQFPPLAYGIYLSHLLPIKVFESAAARVGFSPSWQLDLAIFLASAVAATLIAWVLYQTRWTRWLVA